MNSNSVWNSSSAMGCTDFRAHVYLAISVLVDTFEAFKRCHTSGTLFANE